MAQDPFRCLPDPLLPGEHKNPRPTIPLKSGGRGFVSRLMAGDGQRLPLDLVNHLGRFVDVLRGGTILNQKISLLGHVQDYLTASTGLAHVELWWCLQSGVLSCGRSGHLQPSSWWRSVDSAFSALPASLIWAADHILCSQAKGLPHTFHLSRSA